MSEILLSGQGNLAFIFVVGSVNMKKILTNPKWRKYWHILGAIIIVGLIGFLVPYGDVRWNFLFENMIWLPVELFLTVFAVNKVLELVEEDRGRQRFIRMTSRANSSLIKVIKRNIVSIPINCLVHDANRDEMQLYDEIINSPQNFFTEELFKGERIYNIDGVRKEYNYLGIRMVHCDFIDYEIKNYLDRYELFFDDNLFKQLTVFEQKNFSFGILNNMNDFGRIGQLVAEPGSFKKGAMEYLKEADDLITLLESYED